MSSSSYFPHIPLQLLSFQFTIYCNLVSFAVPLPLCFLKCSVGVASAGYTEKPSTGRTVLLGKRKLYPPVLPTNLPIPAVPTVFSLSAAKTKMSEWEEDFPDDEVEKSPAKALTKTVKPPTPDKIPTSSVLEDEKVPEKPTTCTPPIPTRKASKLKWPPEEESENKIVTSDDIINEQESRLEAELQQLLKDIRRIGEEGKPEVKFGELFDDDKVANYYEALVGTLKSAKKRKLIDFKGQMLLKGAHDNVIISIVGK